MRRLMLAIRVFFTVLLGRTPLERVEQRLLGVEASTAEAASEQQTAQKKLGEPKPVVKVPPPPPQPLRSEALTLLAALQREARFLDIVSEPLGQYSDEQVGAAARDVLRDCGTVLKRMFDLQPVIQESEGSPIEVPADYDPGQFRLTGKVNGQPPYQGTLVHHGWFANRCELPAWSGSGPAARIIASAEVEVS